MYRTGVKKRKNKLAFRTGNSRKVDPTNNAANRIACSDKCLPNNLAKSFSRRSPRGSSETKPCMLVHMADELQNTSQFFAVLQFPRTRWMLRSLVQGLTCFTASACRIIFHITGNQQFFHAKFLCHVRHPRQAQSRAAKAKAQRTKKIHRQELRTGTVALTEQTRRQGIYLNCGGTISQSARKETALCGTPSSRSSIQFLKTREYQATALVRSVRRALNIFRTSTIPEVATTGNRSNTTTRSMKFWDPSRTSRRRKLSNVVWLKIPT